MFALEKGKTREDAKWDDLKHVSQELGKSYFDHIASLGHRSLIHFAQLYPEWFLAGVLAGLPDIMPCLVPTINGYKRLVEK